MFDLERKKHTRYDKWRKEYISNCLKYISVTVCKQKGRMFSLYLQSRIPFGTLLYSLQIYRQRYQLPKLYLLIVINSVYRIYEIISDRDNN